MLEYAIIDWTSLEEAGLGSTRLDRLEEAGIGCKWL